VNRLFNPEYVVNTIIDETGTLFEYLIMQYLMKLKISVYYKGNSAVLAGKTVNLILNAL